MFKGLGVGVTIAVLGLLATSFGVWTAVSLGLAWVISFIFKLDVSYMTVFTVSSVAWLLVIIAKVSFAYLGKKAAERFWN
ncbi:hypothetical protein KQ3_05885 [Bacillus cereus B5-2]|uniref:hypothetical protein n=1 Tax=Bacillus wiedmannii TaxID=1890302 RepID=UPI00032E6EBB|nr:hypothetical protein [Bacillus wiedmannii]EOQ15416.1 hypothetical protein KQ3_05885 [Bacillus cereus B5-2]PEN00089.1 hypothetical protein CN621_16675 [Bacillus wiedmannii]